MNFNFDCLDNNLESFQAQIKPFQAELVVVTKQQPFEIVNYLVQNYSFALGENRVQSILDRLKSLETLNAGLTPQFQMIGHLQRNKAKKLVDKIKLLQTLDSVELAVILEKKCQQLKLKLPVLIEVKTSFESSKTGLEPETEFPRLVEDLQALNLSGLVIKGVMTMAPFTEDNQLIRKAFKKGYQCFNYLQQFRSQSTAWQPEIFSAGMSNDYSIALDEGSNMIRIGTSVFNGVIV